MDAVSSIYHPTIGQQYAGSMYHRSYYRILSMYTQWAGSSELDKTGNEQVYIFAGYSCRVL